MTRKVTCVLAGKSASNGLTSAASTSVKNSVSLTFTGPLKLATKFLSPRKGDIIHAVVAWRNKHGLALLNYWSLPDDAEEQKAFVSLFEEEVNLHKGSDEPVIDCVKSLTPTSKLAKVGIEADKWASPEPWAKRQRIGGA